MQPSRKLTLKREVLQDLSSDELRAVAGAGTTAFSCMTYISCNPVVCLIPSRTECVEPA